MTKKVAISLPDRTLARARNAVRHGAAPTLSNYIASLIDRDAETESFEEMIADFLRETGASEQQIDAARREANHDLELLMDDGPYAKPTRQTG